MSVHTKSFLQKVFLVKIYSVWKACPSRAFIVKILGDFAKILHYIADTQLNQVWDPLNVQILFNTIFINVNSKMNNDKRENSRDCMEEQNFFINFHNSFFLQSKHMFLTTIDFPHMNLSIIISVSLSLHTSAPQYKPLA